MLRFVFVEDGYDTGERTVGESKKKGRRREEENERGRENDVPSRAAGYSVSVLYLQLT